MLSAGTQVRRDGTHIARRYTSHCLSQLLESSTDSRLHFPWPFANGLSRKDGRCSSFKTRNM